MGKFGAFFRKPARQAAKGEKIIKTDAHMMLRWRIVEPPICICRAKGREGEREVDTRIQTRELSRQVHTSNNNPSVKAQSVPAALRPDPK